MSPKITIVLVRSIYPRNVGMCVRAAANMGIENVALVAPQCSLVEEMKQGAAGANFLLEKVKTFGSIPEFLNSHDEGVRIAMSTRGTRIREPENLIEALSKISISQSEINLSGHIYLIFGPEDDGLSPEDMQLAHHICKLPTRGEFKSLNLSHAVLLALHVVQEFVANQIVADKKSNETISVKNEHFFPEQSIRQWLEALGFDLSAPKINAEKTLNRILLENRPAPHELRLLDSILQQNIRKLKQL